MNGTKKAKAMAREVYMKIRELFDAAKRLVVLESISPEIIASAHAMAPPREDALMREGPRPTQKGDCFPVGP